ncbi:uncharacterized protein B0J16DRAFT_400459 [Fusarium flagelliforme]|uniref:uncharacterized protein n=1 Tax=Fusarium flagelliforme TaxID=2675880 RepID=UPI001E8CCA39|nr:uncharacterized protein B0J16DRAFT_400459 [Fusarium flagelliforme]KAH7182273.1 hypothetical protein B0J16DRAFT_400459 [Fusarium flagelliforme]
MPRMSDAGNSPSVALPKLSGGQPALATTSQRALPGWDLEGRYKDLSVQRRFIHNDLLWNLLYRQAFTSRGRPISDEEYEEWVWWKKRLITAPSTQKLANHVCGKAGTDRGRLVSWVDIVGVMDNNERSRQIRYPDPSINDTDTDTALKAPSRHCGRFDEPPMARAQNKFENADIREMRPNALGEVIPFKDQLAGSRQPMNNSPASCRTASEGSFPDDREATPEMAPPAVPTAAQGLFPPDARASREPSLALTEETIMQEFPSYAGHIHRAEHDIRMRHIRERLEGSIAEVSARVTDQEETIGQRDERIAQLEVLLRLEKNGH